MRKLMAIAALSVSACSTTGSHRLYTGLLQPISGTCDPPAQAQLVVRGDVLVFTPNSGTLALRGVQKGNTVAATRTLVGEDRKPYVLEFSGILHGSDVIGTLQTARCRYRVSMHEVAS